MSNDMQRRANGVRWETVQTYAGIPYRLAMMAVCVVRSVGWLCWNKCTTGKWFGNETTQATAK